MGCELQDQAYLNLFSAIIQENGYYDELRGMFMKQKGYNVADMAWMLYNGYEDAPEGISPYWYMDSLEDALADMSDNDARKLHDISDLVETVWDKMAWKE